MDIIYAYAYYNNNLVNMIVYLLFPLFYFGPITIYGTLKYSVIF